VRYKSSKDVDPAMKTQDGAFDIESVVSEISLGEFEGKRGAPVEQKIRCRAVGVEDEE